MIKERPSIARLTGMIVFAFSCAAILLYLWLVFGGSVPLRAEGYRVHVKFPEATMLAEEAQVRISGVPIGKVVSKTQDRRTGLTDAVLEIDPEYAPLPSDSRARLRAKSLLGETYVELTPGKRGSPRLRDGGTLARRRIAPTVELDEVFRTFDPKTRAAFGTWLDQQGRGIEPSGRQLNDGLATLTPFAQDVDNILRLLRNQQSSTRGVVRDTGEVFEALSERRGQLQGLVVNSNRVFETLAARDRRLAETFTAFPTFLRESRQTTRVLTRYAQNTKPLLDNQLRPAARQLSPTLQQLSRLAPDLRGLVRDTGPLVTASLRGQPALRRSLDDTRPYLERLEPYLRSLQPTTQYLGVYKRELAAFFGNLTAATNADDAGTGTERLIKYIRSVSALTPEVLGAYDRRIPTNRANAYPAPGAYDSLARGLPTFGSYQCAQAGPYPVLPAPGADPQLDERIRGLIEENVFKVRESGARAPGCREQQNLGRLVGQGTKFPRLRPIAAP